MLVWTTTRVDGRGARALVLKRLGRSDRLGSAKPPRCSITRHARRAALKLALAG